MKKDFWLGIQEDLFHQKGYAKIFAFLWCFSVIFKLAPRSSSLRYLLPLILNVPSLFLVTTVLIVGRKERRGKKGAKWVIIWFCLLFVTTTYSLYEIITLW